MFTGTCVANTYRHVCLKHLVRKRNGFLDACNLVAARQIRNSLKIIPHYFQVKDNRIMGRTDPTV